MTNKFFERHVFFCTNQRPEGHPKGCCASKNSTVLRAYMKKKTKELVSDKKIRINASGCLDHCEFVFHHYRTLIDIFVLKLFQEVYLFF